MNLLYFVHDLADAAVHRRVSMLADIAEIKLIGFRRTAESITTVGGREAIDLGRTFDARFAHRAVSVLLAAANSSWLRNVMRGTDLFLARQLEMLVLAASARRQVAPNAALVFECLDIHRLMLGRHPARIALRALEARLIRACDGLVVSSPGFLAGYFDSVHRDHPPPLLIENKVLDADIDPDLWPRIDLLRRSDVVAGPPWRIAWYGVIRCRRSLELLAGLVRALPGQIEVVIRGRPSRNVLPDFDEVVQATPGMFFLGAYDRARDLANIYRDAHFTWTLDFYESPGNSDWLLPNRLYEGTLFGCVPLALWSVETGRWLARHGCGVLLDEPLQSDLLRFFQGLDLATYALARRKVGEIPLADLTAGRDECANVCTALAGLTSGTTLTTA
jgi:succinoglycan biosynthesis protein ExoL